MSTNLPYLGFGLGLRTDHYQAVLDTKPNVDWFEILTENYMIPGGKPYHFLMEIRNLYPMVMHGVGLSIGSMDPLNTEYLSQLKTLAKQVEPAWISDHLCWTGLGGFLSHDLLPMPYTEDALNHIVNRVEMVQEYLGRQILLENVSSYVNFTQSEMDEWEFISEVSQRADCFILLDINNIHVSAFNHKFNAEDYLNNIPQDRVQQFHLAGHTNCGTHIIDTHDEPVIDEVWQLYKKALARFGEISTMIERDDNIPALDELIHELQVARDIAKSQYDQQ